MSYCFKVELSKFWFRPNLKEHEDTVEKWIQYEKNKGRLFHCDFNSFKNFSLTLESARVSFLEQKGASIEKTIHWPDVKEQVVLNSTHSPRSIFSNRYFRISFQTRKLLSSKTEGVTPISLHDIASGPQYFFVPLFFQDTNELIGNFGFKVEMNEVLGQNMEILLQRLDLSHIEVFERIPSTWVDHLKKIKIRIQYVDFSMVEEQPNDLQLSANVRPTSKHCIDIFQPIRNQTDFEHLISDVKLSLVEGKDFLWIKHSFVLITLFLCLDQNLASEAFQKDSARYVKSTEGGKFDVMNKLVQLQKFQKEKGWYEIEFGSCLIPLLFNYQGVGKDKITSSTFIQEDFIYHHQFANTPSSRTTSRSSSSSSSSSHTQPRPSVQGVLNILGGPSYSQMIQGFYDGTGVVHGIVPVGFPLPNKLSAVFQSPRKMKHFSHAEQAFREFEKHQEKFFFNCHRYAFPSPYFKANVLFREMQMKKRTEQETETENETETETESDEVDLLADIDTEAEAEKQYDEENEEDEEEPVKKGEEEKRKEKKLFETSVYRSEEKDKSTHFLTTLQVPFSKVSHLSKSPEVFTPSFRSHARRKTFSFGSTAREREQGNLGFPEKEKDKIIQDLPVELVACMKQCEQTKETDIQTFTHLVQKTKSQIQMSTFLQEEEKGTNVQTWEKKIEAHDQIQLNCIHPKLCQFINLVAK